MKFDLAFLARIYRSPFGTWDAICLPALAVEEDAPSRDHALVQLTDQLRTYAATEVIEYLRSHAGDSTRLRCPEATIDLLADRWYCKHTKRECPIDATLDRADIEASLSRCDAPKNVKVGIPAALTDGYAGLHHTSGRYLCPLCGSGEAARFRASSYRYPFELQLLLDVLALSNDELDRDEIRRRVLLHHISLSVMTSATCARCVQGVVVQIDPEFGEELEVVDLSIRL